MSKIKMQGILLIGMPYVGKSTIGKKIAKDLGFKFFDGDTEIEKVIPYRQKYLDDYGDSAYVRMEANVIMKLPRENSVLAPGGSIIYSQRAKKYLKGCFKVYVHDSLKAIKKRITYINKRGIVRLKKKGFDALYNERDELYGKYCDITCTLEGTDFKNLANNIVNEYSMLQLLKNKKKINFVSTNRKSKASFTKAIKIGLAPDKGLFVPEKIPQFSKEEIALMKHLNYQQLAFVLLRQFADINDKQLKFMCEKVYTFDIPIENHKGLYIARLDQGPSASFKDFAAQLLAQMLQYVIKNKKLVILTSTSGDTGGAVASAFKGLRNTKVVILMPKGEVTELQRRQMTTAGQNVTAVLVKGKFDDCQSLAKRAFSEIKGLSSANSINIGRLLPQIVYYFYIYNRTKADTIVVPSGNFGNLVAGVIAKRMGLPINFLAAVNENDEVPKFFISGKYIPVSPSRRCISNAMNVGNPSNLARLLWLYNGIIDENGKLIKMPNMEKMRKDIYAISVTDDETKQAIKEAHKQGILLEPHGAVGYAAIKKLKSKKLGKIVLLETAHIAKFPNELAALKITYNIPKSLSRLKNLKEKYLEINPDFEEFKKLIYRI